MRVALTVLAIGLGLAAAQPASAQINPFRSQLANRLTNDDFQMLSDAGSSLLGREMLAAGDSEGWRNPKTGASGTIEIGRMFKHHGDPCYALHYTTYPGGADGRSTNRTVLNWCKIGDAWKIFSGP